MKNKKRWIFLIVVLLVVITLTGCNYEAPIKPWRNSGFFDVILVRPIAYVLNFISNICGHKLGWGIIFTTILIRTIAWPIYAKSNDMSFKMSQASPELNRLQAKYAGRTDPQSQKKQQMEMMAIYKKYKINPLGCLFPFLQMPIFIAMYHAVKRITINKEGVMNTFSHYWAQTAVVDAEGVVSYVNSNNPNLKFLGIDLSVGAKESWGGYILALLVGVTMFLLQWYSTKKPKYTKNYPTNGNSTAQQQEKMMKFMNYFMVIMMVVAALSNNALALYWVVGDIFSIGQTVINRKLAEHKWLKANEEI